MRRIYVGPWRVDLDIRERVRPALTAAGLHGRNFGLAQVVAVALDRSGAPRPASIGLILTDDPEIATLNERHMGEKGATDVLSFPLLAPEAFPPHEADSDRSSRPPVPFPLPPNTRPHLGDIVISAERAIEQAARGQGGQTGDVRWPAREELRLLAAHGALHVCGWDHADAAEEAAMRRLEREIVSF